MEARKYEFAVGERYEGITIQSLCIEIPDSGLILVIGTKANAKNLAEYLRGFARMYSASHDEDIDFDVIKEKQKMSLISLVTLAMP